METRKIIVVDSSTNSKVTVNTDAETFGQLKAAARSAGISVEGKDWLEGITKTSPVSDDSLLPTNVNYKGTITNTLVYMLTDTNKKIKSGADRQGLYIEVKSMGLQDAIKEAFGRAYTNVPSAILEEFINDAKNSEDVCEDCEYKEKYNTTVKAVAAFLTHLCVSVPGIDDEIKDATEELMKEFDKATDDSVKISDSDIREMFNNI